MATAKKLMRICKAMLLVVSLFALLSCGTEYKLNGDNNVSSSSGNNNNILGTILFYNGSTYDISIHQDAFSGPVLVEKLSPGASFSAEVNPSNNISSVFSVVYWKVIGGEDDIWTKSKNDDRNQISQDIKAGEEYTIRVVPNQLPEFTESFLKIFNASNNLFELRNIGNTYLQANGGMSVQSGNSGIYKIDAGYIEGRFIFISQSEFYPLPNFTAESGYIYTFEFNGNEVTQTAAELI